jgi:hypothetical protein
MKFLSAIKLVGHIEFLRLLGYYYPYYLSYVSCTNGFNSSTSLNPRPTPILASRAILMST